MSCSGLKMFLVPRSSILAAWAGASLSPGLVSAAFSARLEAVEVEEVEVETLLTIRESRERLMLEVIRDVEQLKWWSYKVRRPDQGPSSGAVLTVIAREKWLNCSLISAPPAGVLS